MMLMSLKFISRLIASKETMIGLSIGMASLVAMALVRDLFEIIGIGSVYETAMCFRKRSEQNREYENFEVISVYGMWILSKRFNIKSNCWKRRKQSRLYLKLPILLPSIRHTAHGFKRLHMVNGSEIITTLVAILVIHVFICIKFCLLCGKYRNGLVMMCDGLLHELCVKARKH